MGCLATGRTQRTPRKHSRANEHQNSTHNASISFWYFFCSCGRLSFMDGVTTSSSTYKVMPHNN
jgi:hypothetical protein